MRVLILLTDTGGGHHRASLALKEVIEQDNGNEVKIVEALSYCSNFLHFCVSKGYLLMVRRMPDFYGKFYTSADKVSAFDKLVHSISAFYAKRLIKLLDEFQPDCIISCHAFCNEMISSLKAKGKTDIPLFSVITDYSAHAAYINENVDAYIVGTNDLVTQLSDKYGVDGSIIYPLGIPVFSSFDKHIDKREARKLLKLNPNKKTVLMMAGSFGVENILEIYTNLNKYPSNYQLVIVTGKNDKLYKKFKQGLNGGYVVDTHGRKIKIRIPTKLCFFVDNIDEYMSAADVILTKPGGLTISEAMAKELPMAVFYSYSGQESENADYLERHRLGIKLKTDKTLARQLNDMLHNDELLETMHKNIKTFKKQDSSKNLYRLLREKVD